MFLNVVIPVKDCADNLERLLSSVPTNLSDDFHILLIYYKSKDLTFEIANRYSTINENISLLSYAKKGIYTAMNEGIRKSSSDYIVFIGGDDKIIFNNISLIKFEINYLPKKPDLCLMPVYISHHKKEKLIIPKADKPPYMYHHQSILFKKRFLLDNNLFYSEKYKIHSDFDFIQKCFNQEIKNISRLKNPLVFFGTAGTSTSAIHTYTSSIELAKIFFKYKSFFTYKFFISIMRKIFYFFKSYL
tara:strand:- start:249 stop:983 length:735 start_codon:yes stop_codon:yes gene_type:complete